MQPTSSRRSEVFRIPLAVTAAAVLVAALAPEGAQAAPKAATKYDWPQFAFDAGKSADNLAESTVNLSNVSGLKQRFKVALPDAPDGSPVYLSDVTTPKGVKDLVYVQGEHGRLIAFDGATGATVWSDNFGPGGISNSSPAIDPNRQFIYINANNGKTFVPGKLWRQSWVAVPADGHTTMRNGGGYPVDSYTPSNWSASVKSDQDIGSGGLLILPTTLSTKFPHLGVQPGKDSKIRLLNLADLSGKGTAGRTGGELQLFSFSAMGNMRSQGAVWTDPATGAVWVFVTGHGGVAGFQVTVDSAGTPTLVLKWSLLNGWTSSAFVANGVLFAANGAGEHTTDQKLHQVQAINPTTGKVAWTGGIGLHHWSSPILANGVVYMVDGNSGGFGSGTTRNPVAWSLGGGLGPPRPGSRPPPRPPAGRDGPPGRRSRPRAPRSS